MTTKAKRRAKVAVQDQPETIDRALVWLDLARGHLRLCGCAKAADYVGRAIKSAQGARRHAEHMANEERWMTERLRHQ